MPPPCLLLASTFAVPWYRVKATSINGWDALTDLRWLLIVTIIAALALAYFQATRRAPAIPVSLSVIVTVLGLLTSLRADLPGADQRAGF